MMTSSLRRGTLSSVKRSSPTPPDTRRSTLANVRVLVVDDHEDARDLVATVLERAGAKVTQADSVSTAMLAIANDAFSVLVSDIGMPGEDDGLIRRLRSGEGPPTSRELPAVAITAFAAPEDRSKALQAGFQEHMAKPFSAPVLLEVVARLAGPSTDIHS